MDKRGVSTIITTFILISLVLVAVVIVWVVMKNIISGETEEIESGKFTIGIGIKEVKIIGDNISIQIKRDIGKGNIIGIKFSFDDGGDSFIINKYIEFNELEERKFIFTGDELTGINLSELKEISIAPILKTESGKEILGISVEFNKIISSGGGNGNGGDSGDSTITCYLDSDNDNYGDALNSQEVTSCPVNYVLDNTDCNDSNFNINPGVTEICDNYVDDNCDGNTDEGCFTNAFTSVWKTDNIAFSSDYQIELPLESSGTYNFDVDWGDGTQDTITEWNQAEHRHTYSAIGIYEIKITGEIKGFRLGSGVDKLKILEIKNWGPLNLGNNGAYFYHCENLIITATDVLDLTGTTDLSFMFYDAKSLTTIPNMNDWDMSSVTNMERMFNGADNFNQNIGSWNVSSVTNMKAMFDQAYMFNQDIGAWDVSRVENMGYIFYKADSFNQNIRNWDVSSVTDMSSMFSYADSFNQDIGNWNVSNVINTRYMFAHTDSFNQNIGNWNVSSVTNMEGMFYDAFFFNKDIGNWNVSSVTNMYAMFWGTNFNQDIGNWDVSSVTNMKYMFRQAYDFNKDIGNWNVSSVTNMEEMFYHAEVFNQDLSSWNVDQVTACSDFATFADAWTLQKPGFTNCTL